MDSISVAIIVAVLSVGSVLVYLFQSDYERRQRSKLQGAASLKRANQKQPDGKPQVSKSASVGSKQVPSEIEKATSQPLTVNSSNSNNTNVTVGSSKAHITSENTAPNSRNTPKPQQSALKVARNKRDTNDVGFKGALVEETRGMDPSFDELDSSVLLSVFSQSHSKLGKQSAKKSQSSPPPEKKASRKALSSQRPDYSPGQLLSMIAASSLSKDEVELAIEMLLNKVESGESDWKQPKSDPLRRLKSQLRENELALQTEIQNHEHSRAHLAELKSQIQGERSLSNAAKEELSSLKKEFGFVNMALGQTRDELSKQQQLRKKLNEDSAQLVQKLEQDKAHLQAMLANTSVSESEVCKLREELNEKMGQLQHYELSNHAMAEQIQKLESKLCKVELQLDQMRSSKQHDDYEACAKITELESDRSHLDKTVKDHVARLRELCETNNLLEKSVKELQLINSRQEDMLKRLRDERHVNEASMKRTLCEMEHELKELHGKLSANSASHDERLRKEMSQAERELSDADQREQRLQAELKELREGLSALLPVDVKTNQTDMLNGRSGSWVQQYLAAFKQLSRTVEELKETNNNNHDSPSRSPMIDKSTSTLHTNGNSSRIGSPTSNGRSSRGKHLVSRQQVGV